MRFVLFFLLPIILTTAASAACLSPAGSSGQMIYISPSTMFCDGFGWSKTDVTTTGTSCTQAGQITMSGTALQFCNGSFWVTMMGTLTNGTCAATGTIQYNAAKNWIEACDGTNWKPLGNTTPTVTTQVKSWDGTIPTGKTFALPAFSSAVGVGDAILCRFYEGTSTTVSTLTDNKGGVYTNVVAPFADSFGTRQEVWISENSAGGTGLIVSGTASTPGQTFGFECTDIKGVVPTGVVDQATKISGTTDTAGGTPITTTSAREYIYISTFSQGATGCSTPSGSTTISNWGFDNAMGKIVSSLGTYPTPTGSGCGTAWTEIIVSLRLK
jgi:hypothetical protein